MRLIGIGISSGSTQKTRMPLDPAPAGFTFTPKEALCSLVTSISPFLCHRHLLSKNPLGGGLRDVVDYLE